MNAVGRLAVYTVGLAVAFTGAFGIAAVAVPRSVVAAWEKESTVQSHSGMAHGESSMQMPAGLSASADGCRR